MSPLAAFAAGALSFLSPCLLPLIPSYLSFIGGISCRELSEGKYSRPAVLGKTLLFVLGFGLVFTALGALFSAAGGLLGEATGWINSAAGLVVALLGLNFTFDFWKLLDMERRFHLRAAPAGASGSLLLGMAFAAGWTPCVGPILASILFLAGSRGRLGQGVLLLALYSLGLGFPFLLAGLFFARFTRQSARLKPHLDKIRIASGLFLVLIGLAMLLGRLQGLGGFLASLARALETWGKAHSQASRWLFGLPLFLPALGTGLFYARRVAGQGRMLFLPLPLSLTFIFLLLAALILSGAVDAPRLIAAWFSFQGL